MFDVKIYFEFRNDYLGRMSEFIITKKSDWASKGWLSYGFDPALNETDFYYETTGINDGISTEKINISFLNSDSDLYLDCDNGYFSNYGTEYSYNVFKESEYSLTYDLGRKWASQHKIKKWDKVDSDVITYV